MPNSLTDTNISDTYKQVLHVSGGVGNATQKRVRDGDGTATAIMVSSLGAQEAVKGMSVDGTSSADAFDLNAYDSTKQQIGDEFIRAMVDLFYPIGSLYIQGDVIDRAEQSDGTFKNDAYVANPETRFPGTTWERVSKGRALVGVGNVSNEPTPGGYTKSAEKDPYSGLNKFNYDAAEVAKSDLFDPSGSNLRVFAGPDVWWYNLDGNNNYWNLGDTKISGFANFKVGYYEHQLTVQEMPSHSHQVGEGSVGPQGAQRPYTSGDDFTDTASYQSNTTSVGSDQPHNNISPYYGVFIWKRVK